MSDKQPCQQCGYIEDASAWHYEDCIIMEDPMTMWHITKIHEQRLEINRLKRQYEIAMDLIQSWKVKAQCITSWTDELVQFAESPEHEYSELMTIELPDTALDNYCKPAPLPTIPLAITRQGDFIRITLVDDPTKGIELSFNSEQCEGFMVEVFTSLHDNTPNDSIFHKITEVIE
jgi:hypothetical protein